MARRRRPSPAEWILTFDDGPLPADVTEYDANDPRADDKLLRPLEQILETLRSRRAGRIKAVFFLRGRGFPWKKRTPKPPPVEVFEDGVAMIVADGHRLGLHCYSHDPKIWRVPFESRTAINEDLKTGRRFFEEECGAGTLTTFRPPYGGGGSSAMKWAERKELVFHRWDIDPEDWLHHPDAGLFRRFERQGARHRKHVVDRLHLGAFVHAIFPNPNDFLFHVSKRTAKHLDAFLSAIENSTRSVGRDSKWVVPDSY